MFGFILYGLDCGDVTKNYKSKVFFLVLEFFIRFLEILFYKLLINIYYFIRIFGDGEMLLVLFLHIPIDVDICRYHLSYFI